MKRMRNWQPEAKFLRPRMGTWVSPLYWIWRLHLKKRCWRWKVLSSDILKKSHGQLLARQHVISPARVNAIFGLDFLPSAVELWIGRARQVLQHAREKNVYLCLDNRSTIPGSTPWIVPKLRSMCSVVWVCIPFLSLDSARCSRSNLEFMVIHSIISRRYVDGEVRSNSSKAGIVKYEVNARVARMHILVYKNNLSFWFRFKRW